MQNFKENAAGGDFYEMPNVPLSKGGAPTSSDIQIKQKNSESTEKITKNIIIIGLYAALFTIFSVTVQVFEFVCDIEAIVGFLLLLTGILLCFVLALDAMARGWSKNETTYPTAQSILIAGIVIAMIAIGLYLVKNTGDTWHCQPGTQLTYVK